MLMLILQYQFTEFTSNEYKEIPLFNNMLCDVIFSKINTKVNRRKIELRLDYLLNKVDWIDWKKSKYEITVSELMSAIHRSIIWQKKRKNIFNIIIDTNVLIPHSYTSIEKFIKFLEYGNNKFKATGIISTLENQFNHTELMSLWQLLLYKDGLGITNSKIIARI